ncbi:DUF6233 domain-containing protein [Streptomyces goshikiensis]|uniref:DUF6233 domain-containing protein n=1 Tax=Streptomyces goshikiensis TaxID=1942 RepID=UPI0033B42A68
MRISSRIKGRPGVTLVRVIQGRASGAVRGLNRVRPARPTYPSCGRWPPTCAANSAARNRPPPPRRARPPSSANSSPPEPPAWLVERGIGVHRLPVRVHTRNCWDTRSRCTPAGADQIRPLLAQVIPACIHWQPDTALGMLE